MRRDMDREIFWKKRRQDNILSNGKYANHCLRQYFGYCSISRSRAFLLAQTGRSSVNNNKSTQQARQSVSLSREDIPAAPGLFFKLFLYLSSLLKYDIHDMIQYNIMKYNEIDYQLYDTIYPLIFLHFLFRSLYLMYLISFKYYISRGNGLD